MGRPAISTVLLASAAWLAGLAAVIALTGGGAWSIGHVRLLSLRAPARPLIAALILTAIAYWLDPPAIRARAVRVREWCVRQTIVFVGVVMLVVIAVGLHWGTHAASGADAYGYVSQASLWLSGHLIVFQPPPHGWPFSEWTLSPLGYRPGLEPHTIVPTYSPGLPLLMAAAIAVLGSSGPFVVVPLLGGLGVLLTFLVGTRLFGRGVGFVASAWLAASPAFLFQLMWPMSDVPALTGWTLALLFALLEPPFATGLAAGCAVLIRPNLAPLAVPLLLLSIRPVEWDRRSLVAWSRRAVAAGAGLLPAVLAVALFYDHLFGSPLRSGYGSASSIYD